MMRTMRALTLIVTTLVPSLALSTVLSVNELLPDEIVHPADQNPPVAETCDHSSDAFRCVQYLYNHDGDTLTVRVPNVHPLLGEKISVRIRGIDTPEMYSSDLCERRAAVIAQRFVKNILSKAQRIDLVSVQRDKYFRILADVRSDSERLAEILLLNGLAYPYNGGAKSKINWCETGSSLIQ